MSKKITYPDFALDVLLIGTKCSMKISDNNAEKLIS
jgi:hypothetical protein